MDTREFEILAASLRPRVLRTSRQIIGNDADAEDVTQDTMLKLWTLRSDLGEYRSVEALAVLVAKRLSLNHMRHQQILRPESLESIAIAEPSTEEMMIGRQRTEYVDSILARLPDSQQTLIRLRHIDGMGNNEIARLLGSSEGAVRTALSRARRRIAEMFNPENF